MTDSIERPGLLHVLEHNPLTTPTAAGAIRLVSPASTSISQTLLPTKPFPPRTTTLEPDGAAFGVARADAVSGTATTAAPTNPAAKAAGTAFSRVRRSICPESKPSSEVLQGEADDVDSVGVDDDAIMCSPALLLPIPWEDFNGTAGDRNELQHAMAAATMVKRNIVQGSSVPSVCGVRDAGMESPAAAAESRELHVRYHPGA